MALKVLDPVANGFYNDYIVDLPPFVGWMALSDQQHFTYTAPTVSPGATAKESYKFAEIPADVPPLTPVSRVQLYYEPLTVGCGTTAAGLTVKPLTRQAATNLLGPDLAPVMDAGPSCQAGPLAIKSHIFPVRYDGAAWTVADFQGGSRAEFGIEVHQDTGSSSTIPYDSKLWLEVEYQTVTPNFDAARDVGSRIQRQRRRVCFTYELTGPLWWLDIELLDDVMVEYLAADDPNGVGWLSEAWQRGWLVPFEIGVNRNTNRVTLRCWYYREYACLHWDTMTSEASAGLYGLGAARLGLGELRTFTRATAAWVKDPTTLVGGMTKASTKGGLYYLAVDGTEKVTSAGTLIFNTRTNKLLHSSYIQGILPVLTGHTFEGTGGGNTVAGVEFPTGYTPLFVPDVGARAVKIVKAIAVDVQDRNNAVVAVAANAVGYVSVGHLDVDNTKPGKVAIRRIVAGVTRWWNVAGQTWDVGKVWNVLTGSSTQPVVDRFKIPFGVTAGTLEAMLGVDAAASNRTFYGLHAEWVEGAYVSEELIVTTTVPYTVAIDELSDANDSGSPAESKRIFPATDVTWYCEAAPGWAVADLAAGEKRVLLAVEFDANNSIVVYYDKDSGRVKADYKQGGGAPSTASVATTPLKGTFERYALRIVGASGQEGQTPYTMKVYAGGAAGNIAAIVTPITMPSTGTVKRGRQGSNQNMWDGYIRNWETTPEVLSDAEIQGRP